MFRLVLQAYQMLLSKKISNDHFITMREVRKNIFAPGSVDVIQNELKIFALFPNQQIWRSYELLIQNTRIFLINKNVVLNF